MKKQAILLTATLICTLLLCSTISAAEPSTSSLNINKTGKIAILNANSQASYYHQILTEEGKKLNETLNVSVYAGTTTSDPSIPNEEKIPSDINLSSYDVVFVCGWNTVAPGLPSKLDDAKQYTNVIVINPSALSSGNVDLNKHPNIAKYWSYPTAKNLRNLIIYLGINFCGLNATVEAPETMASLGIYHPDAHIQFNSLTDYLEWYENQDPNYTYDPAKITVGILASRSHITNNNTKATDCIIKTLEGKGCNVIAVFGSSQWDVQKFLAKDGKSFVDVIISILYNVQNEAENFKFLDVPILYGVGIYYESPEQWENGKEGIFPHQVPYIGVSETYGLIEPTVVYAQVIDNTTTGAYHYEPITYQIDYITDRAIAWAKLREMSNSEKKVVITYYNDGGGKANMGTEMEYYLDVPASIINLLHEMELQGYDLGGSIPNLETLTDLMVNFGRNIGPWAPGELDVLVKTGNPILVPEETYLSWFRELPLIRQEEMIKSWGEPLGNLMVWNDSLGNRYIVIPVIQLGNVIITPHPIRPAFAWQLYEENGTFSTDQGEIPPHHQYVAFYLAMNKIFGADAFVQMWSPFPGIAGKQVGLGKNDWNGILLGNMINLRPFPLYYNPETHRRRGGFVIVSHLPPTMVPSDLYGDLTTIQQKITLYNQVTEEGTLKDEYRQTIISECKRLGLDLDLNVDLSTLNDAVSFENFLQELSVYLNEIKVSYIPYGLHILGQAPANESLVAMVESMFGDSFQKNVSTINSQQGVTTKLLTEVLLNGLTPEEAQNKVLREVSANITADLNLALNYRDMINESSHMEISELLSALNGQYVQPSIYGDLVGHPELLPTGKNLYSFDGRLMPTKEAWTIAVELVEQQLAAYKETHDNTYPNKIAFVLWKSETCRHQGVMEAEILYLLGVRPVWNKYNRWSDVELIPSSELGRPRIDVVITSSGSYRDMFGYKFQLLEKAVKLAASANDTEYPNYVKEHSEALYPWLMENGYNSTEASDLSTARIFSHEVGRFGTGLSDAVGMDTQWDDEDDLANVYISATSYIYGANFWNLKAEDIFRKNLDGVDVGIFSTTSSVVGVLDQGVDSYLGGLALAVRSVSGVTPDLYINNLRDYNNPTVESLSRTVNRELRSRYLNPKWITGMMENGYAGAKNMEEFVETIWNWNVEVPSLISENTWNQIYETYVLDKHGLGLNEFFNNKNPYAKQSVIARMIEVSMKGYWNPSQGVKTALANEYVHSVVQYGVTCCHHTCANLAFNNLVISYSSLSLQQLEDFASGVMSATGKSLTIGSTGVTPQAGSTQNSGSNSAQGASSIGEQSSSSSSTNSQPAIESQDSSQTAGSDESKAYEVSEKNTGSSQSSVPVYALIGVLIIIGLIGVGYFKTDFFQKFKK